MPLRENVLLWNGRATASDRRNAAIDVALGFAVRVGTVTGLMIVASALLQLAGTPRERMPMFAVVIALAGLAPGPIAIVRMRGFWHALDRLRARPPRSPAARRAGMMLGRLFFPLVYLVIPVTWLLVWIPAIAVSVASIAINFRIAVAIRAVIRTEGSAR